MHFCGDALTQFHHEKFRTVFLSAFCRRAILRASPFCSDRFIHTRWRLKFLYRIYSLPSVCGSGCFFRGCFLYLPQTRQKHESGIRPVCAHGSGFVFLVIRKIHIRRLYQSGNSFRRTVFAVPSVSRRNALSFFSGRTQKARARRTDFLRSRRFGNRHRTLQLRGKLRLRKRGALRPFTVLRPAQKRKSGILRAGFGYCARDLPERRRRRTAAYANRRNEPLRRRRTFTAAIGQTSRIACAVHLQHGAALFYRFFCAGHGAAHGKCLLPDYARSAYPLFYFCRTTRIVACTRRADLAQIQRKTAYAYQHRQEPRRSRTKII